MTVARCQSLRVNVELLGTTVGPQAWDRERLRGDTCGPICVEERKWRGGEGTDHSWQEGPSLRTPYTSILSLPLQGLTMVWSTLVEGP